MTQRSKRLLVVGSLFLAVGLASLTYAFQDRLEPILASLTGPSKEETVENLRAFAKLYGYVRYFHPSDATAETNWDKFATHGVRKVKDATSRTELQSDLEVLFEPLAPTVQLYRTGTEPPNPAGILTPPDTAGIRLVTWQHEGIEFSRENTPRSHRSLAKSLETYRSIRLNRPPGRAPLFDERSTSGELVTKPIGRGLSAQVPLALYSRDGQTLRPDGAPSPEALRDSIAQLDVPVLDTSVPRRLASVTIAWNVFQHFYPYSDVVEMNWDQVLSQSLRRALADTSRAEFRKTLRRMLVPLKDGHAHVHDSRETEVQLPLQFEQIEGKTVVVDTASYGDSQSCPQPEDIVTSIGGTSAEEALNERKRYISGSPQRRTVRALRQLGDGPPETTLSLTLQRGDRTVECQVPRAIDSKADRWEQALQNEPRPTPIDTLSESTLYVDLTRAKWPTIQSELDELAQSEDVIFDLRGSLNRDTYKIIDHLIADTVRKMYLQIPQFVYPDQENLAGYDTSRAKISPQAPRLNGTIAFLTNAEAISAPEGMLAIIKHYELATLVGQPTGGANGLVNPFTLPGEYHIYWTGMRVRKHDGSQHHLVGIQPDVPATRTIEGVREGRDEVLEKALEVLQKDDSTENDRRIR